MPLKSNWYDQILVQYWYVFFCVCVFISTHHYTVSSRIFSSTVLNQNFILKEFLFRAFHSRGPSQARDQINNQDQNNNKGCSDPTASANTDVDDLWRWNGVASGQQHKWTIKLLQTQYGCSQSSNNK